MSPDSTFVFSIEVPRQVSWKSTSGLRRFSREDFFAFLWQEFGDERGLVGIHEGTLLSEDAFKKGLETESWTVDSAEAPRERDWVDSMNVQSAVLYFSSRELAARAHSEISGSVPFEIGNVTEQVAEDWDAKWKASYQGVFIPPSWEVRPPWFDEKTLSPGHRLIRLNPGAGFGTGTHETTQLCLQALERAFSARAARGEVLDFGSGSGILAFAAAILGAHVDAVEIDELAVDNARENAALNGIEGQIEFALKLTELSRPSQKYDVVLANILRPVLVEFARELTGRMKSDATLILSGLIDRDVDEIVTTYSRLLPSHRFETTRLNEWRGVVFTPRQALI